MAKEGSNWKFTYTVPANATIVRYVFNNGSGTWDNNGGGNWNINVSSAPPPTEPPPVPTGLQVTATTSTSISLAWTPSATATSYIVFRNGNQIGTPQDPNYVDSSLLPENNYTYTVRAVNVAGSSASSSAVSGSTSFAPLNPNQITVVDPATPGQSSGSPHTFRGRAGAAFTNGLTWSNPATGATGLVAFPGGSQPNGWEWTASVGLGAGANAVTFSGTYATSSTQTLTDSPANYTGWSTGGTGGTGFGAWSLTSSGSGGHFLAQQSVHTNMSVGASTGFGLWANTGGISTATRNFNTAMAAGDSFALRFDNNWLVDGGETGFTLADSNGVARLRFYFVGGQGNYRITDATSARDSGWAYTGDGLNLTVTLTSGSAYTLSDGTRNLSGTLAAAGGAISRLVVENKNAGPDTERNLYIGAMTHTRQLADSGTVTSTASALSYNPVTDGIADSWWASYGIIGPARVAANDPDGDGFNNAQENALGTSPVDASSTFKVGTMERTGNALTVSWPSIAGKKYQVQKRASLSSGDWVNSGSQVTAAGTSSSATVDVSDSPNASFVRVILVP
jgi:hypothetical protein